MSPSCSPLLRFDAFFSLLVAEATHTAFRPFANSCCRRSLGSCSPFSNVGVSGRDKDRIDRALSKAHLGYEQVLPVNMSVSGVGHSIGTVVLLILAGATASTLMGDRLSFMAGRSVDRLVLLTPPTDFFRHPDALALVQIPIQIWAGGKDTITPPIQANFLKDVLADTAQVEIIVIEDASHFTFMNELPPNVTDAHFRPRCLPSISWCRGGRFLAA